MVRAGGPAVATSDWSASVNRPHATILSFLLAAGCIRQVGSGPFVGDCAEYPDGVYTYGQIGIGTCIAGPVDIEFIEKDLN